MKKLIKQIRQILLPAFTLFFITSVQAQKVVEKSAAYTDGQEIVLELPIGKTIKITGWDKKEVALKASVNINNNTLNEAYSLEVAEGEAIRMEAALDEEKLKNGKAEDCTTNYSFQTTRNGKQTTVCAEIFYEIRVPRTANLRLETISADVEATGLAGPTHLKSISGFIDLSWPQQQDAELQLKSITGELYTDLAFDILYKKENAPLVGYDLKGRNGKGGPLLELETISSNIYLRQSK